MTRETVTPLTIVSGGKAAPLPSDGRSLEQIVADLGALPPKRQLDALISHPHSRSLVRTVPEPTLFWLVKELGLADSGELLELASPEQVRFCLDLDLWEQWTLQPGRLLEWLQAILQSETLTALAKLRAMDVEMLILFLKQEITVGGGLQILSHEEETTEQWDQTFDEVYFVNYLDREHAPLIAQLLQLLCQEDQSLYVSLMEGVKAELTADLEEVCYQFRSGRLGDFGFPELTEAMGLFTYLDPDAYVPSVAKEVLPPTDCPFMPIRVQGPDLIYRALAEASPATREELQVLFNHALVAEGAPFADGDAMREICARVCGYLNIALEQLCGDDVRQATDLLEREYLRRLCRQGYSRVLQLRRRAEKVSRGDLGVNHPTERAMEGLLQRHPRFYRGLDPDQVNGYRNFRTSADLGVMERFLEKLSGA